MRRYTLLDVLVKHVRARTAVRVKPFSSAPPSRVAASSARNAVLRPWRAAKIPNEELAASSSRVIIS